MANINFVPDDYVQSRESSRTNLICLALLAVVMAALAGSFITIKIRQGACRAQEALINTRLAKIQLSIKQFEELQTKRKAMMKTALTTAELLEPVPRSLLLASLTNNLPPGVSLLELKFVQKQPKQSAPGSAARSKYDAAKEDSAGQVRSRERAVETTIDIGGMAPSDLQVAAYIEHLGQSSLLENVSLVESKEYKVEDGAFRQFKLKAKLRNDVRLTSNDIEAIRTGARESVYRF